MNKANVSIRMLTLLALGLTHAPAAVMAASPTSASFDARGVKIHYVTAGKGQPVVLIHGLHASAEMNWNLPGVVAELAKDHQVIALDLPGHGQSDRPNDEAAYGLQVVEDVALLLDHLKIKQAHIVGYSLGGMVAVKFMATHPERVLSGTVAGMGWFREGSGLSQIWDRIPARDESRTPAALVHSIGKFAVTKEELLSIRAPVKVIVGDRDPCQQMYVAPLRAVRSDWPVVTIADAGHITCVAKPEFREEIASWIRKHSD
jgi:pimeloyl-ACP methyl ester carboxylesterase